MVELQAAERRELPGVILELLTELSASNRSHGVRGQMSANHRLASRPTLGHDACGQYRG